MRSMTWLRLFTRSVVLAVAVVAPWAAASCGGSSSDKPAAGSGGSAGAPVKPEPITCGAETCTPLSLSLLANPVPACCTADGACGLDSTPLEQYGFAFDETCQATHQAGDADANCPASPELMIPSDGGTVTAPGFPGCCRAETQTCGYLMNKFGGIVPLNPPLGCVDSAPFLDGGTPSPCGSGGASH
jgi:hypothetical protein